MWLILFFASSLITTVNSFEIFPAGLQSLEKFLERAAPIIQFQENISLIQLDSFHNACFYKFLHVPWFQFCHFGKWVGTQQTVLKIKILKI
jgi:hypothetical protein